MVFKAYDVRGIYPKEINEEFAFNFGKALAKYFDSDTVAVARDGRLSSDSLFEKLCDGINLEGKNVVNLGLISTPAAYFALINLKIPGVIITASHNPKEYNGFKVVDEKLMPVDKESGLLKIKELMTQSSKNATGGIINFDLALEYEKFLNKFKDKQKDLKIVVDQSNGSSHLESAYLKKHFNATILNSEVDGNFPGHDPDPFKKTSIDFVSKKVIESNADIGIIFDGDGDRAVFIDEKGNPLRPEIAMCLFAKKGPILYDVRCSLSLRDVAKENNVKSYMIKAGRSFFIREMKPKNAFYGVEGSGHYFFKEFENFDSAIIMILKVLSALSNSNKKLSELTKSFSRYHHSSEVNFKVKSRDEAIEKIKQSFKPKKLVEIDGVSLYLDDFWLNIRKSNTEPVIRINAEANSKQKVDNVIKKIKEILK
ncbi:MAG: phosphomannomutase/phosphoglucomutase [Candidatus Woesearchaeota archaeon]